LSLLVEEALHGAHLHIVVMIVDAGRIWIFELDYLWRLRASAAFFAPGT
jgi:hypothetical protein